MRTVVVTDSSGRPASAAASPAVVVVPITILLNDRQEPDDRIDPALVDRAIARGEPIKTRAPSVIDYLEAVERSDATSAVILTPAAELTAMWRHACYTPWLADRPVAVVDSRTAASGQGLVVEAAAAGAAAGISLADVVGVARDAARRARVLGAVVTAEPLIASGMVEQEQLRVETGPAPRRGARQRRDRPTIFEARQGLIEPLSVLGDEDAMAVLAALFARERRAGSPVVFTGAGADEAVRSMAVRLAGLVGAARAPEACSPAMTIYTGRGVVGVAWLDRA